MGLSHIFVRSCHRLLVFSLILEIESLGSLDLIRLESQFQKPQKQLRNVIIKILVLQRYFGTKICITLDSLIVYLSSIYLPSITYLYTIYLSTYLSKYVYLYIYLLSVYHLYLSIIYLSIQLYYKELAHMIMEAETSQNLSLQAGNPGEPRLYRWFQSEFKSEVRRLISQFADSQAERTNSPLCRLIYF